MSARCGVSVSTDRIAALLFAWLLLVISPGCQLLESLGRDTSKPSAQVRDVHIEDLRLDSATLLFDVEVTNPYSVALPLLDLQYALESKGQEILTGTSKLAGTIPAGGSKVLPLPTTVSFSTLLATLSEVKPGAVIPYVAALTLSVDAPVVGRLALPLKKEGQLPIPTVPDVALRSVSWESLTLNEAKANLDLHLVNRNEFPINVKSLQYDLSLGGSSIANSSFRQEENFPAGGEKDLRIGLSFSPKSLGFAAFSMLRGQDASYQMKGSLVGETPFGPVDLPYDASGKTVFKHD